MRAQHDQPVTAHDPALHESPPRTVMRGGAPQWAKRRGGAAKHLRAPGSIGASRAAPPSAPAAPADVAAPTSAAASNAQAVGFMATGAFLSICNLIGGDEFTAEPGEEEALSSAATMYCEAKGFTDLPPGVALVCVVAVFVAKRWNKPVFAAKRETWLKSFKKPKPEETKPE